MDKIQKLLKSIPKKDHAKIMLMMEKVHSREISVSQKQSLKGHEYIYRVRVGHYRIIYFDDGQEIILKAIRKRNEKTYKMPW